MEFDPAKPEQFQGWLEGFGLDIRVTGWSSVPEATDQYQTVASGISRGSALDVGCNLGFLSDYLEQQGIVTADTYDGIDCLPFLVQAAKTRRPDWRFHHAYLSEWTQPAEHVIACGVLNYGPEDYLGPMLQHLWNLAIRSLSMNVPSDQIERFLDLCATYLGTTPAFGPPSSRGWSACRILRTA